MTPKEHGFGFSTDSVGIALTISGFMLLFFQGYCFTYLSNRFQLTTLFAIAAAQYYVLLIAFPSLSYIATNRVLLWFLLSIHLFFRTCVGAVLFTVIFIQIAKSCPTEYRGVVNGFAQSLAALGRTISPLLGGWVWNVSLQIDHPLSHYLVFILMIFLNTVMCWGGYRVACLLPATTNAVEVNTRHTELS
eukprot:c8197_g1_i1.p2 GENE.c8197_g1_i1~~c8197_g1_i1.p2  ORF type:complete len:190 (-),score=42.41 c8197_g1_i1:42-611(-)